HIEPGVRVDQINSGNRSLEHERLVRVEFGRERMVRQDGQWSGQESDGNEQKLRTHGIPPGTISSQGVSRIGKQERLLPSGKSIVRQRIANAPFRARAPVTRIRSPGLMELFVQPRRDNS